MIDDPVVISLQSTKVCVFSDSVLCLGKVLQHPECNEAWKNRVAGVRAERNYSDFEDVKGESAKFEWNIFPGFTTLQLCDKISNLLSSLGQSPEAFTRRILFVSMFNDMSCDSKSIEEQCSKDADFVKTFAKRFEIGQWSFIGPSSDLQKVDIPSSRATTPIVQRKIENKGKGKVSIHFSVCRIILSANQL